MFDLRKKTDETFPNQQFNISNYKTLLWDINQHGEGLLKCLTVRTFQMILKWCCLDFGWRHESIFELVFINHHPKTKTYFLDIFSKVLTKLTCQYDSIMLIEDFNLSVYNINLRAIWTHSI